MDENENLDNILFTSRIDINELKKDNMKPSDLNIDKELVVQSKKNIILNNEEDFLSSRKWDYTDNNKIKIIDDKIKLIYENMDKRTLEILNRKIDKCDLNYLYNNFNPREVINRIGTLSSLDFLIETTYYPPENFIKQMFSDKKNLEKYVYKFRNILGDGDCFYRGLIFSYLENIVLINNINLMKELLVLFYDKINTKNPLVKQKDYLREIKKMNISIVYQILYILLNCMKKNGVQNTYFILLKVFLYCKEFDYGIIYFTRYLLYEYISTNENKIYSKENPIKIGCFLPENFVEDRGDKDEYFFENYYSLQLMKPKTFAEKIVIYIAPFVFNCDLNILIYDYGSDSLIQEKKFKSDKKSEFQINLLFRKAHYDLYYTKEFYLKHSDFLDLIQNIQENITYLNSKTPEELMNKNNNLNNDGLENDKKYEQYYEKLENINSYNNYDSPKCLECHKSYNNKENAFGLCSNCLLDNLKTQLCDAYLSYIKYYHFQSDMDFNDYIINNKISISVQDNITLKNAILNSGYKFEDLFLQIRKNMCLYCGNGFSNNNSFIELPCQCCICDKNDCFEEYIKINKKTKNKNKKKENGQEGSFYSPMKNCPCGAKINLNYIISMINIIDEKKLNKHYKEEFQELILIHWKWRCMFCGENFNNETNFYRVFFNDDKIEKKFLKKKTEFSHLICLNCGRSNRIREDQDIRCNFCDSNHKVNSIKNVDKNNITESNCMLI